MKKILVVINLFLICTYANQVNAQERGQVTTSLGFVYGAGIGNNGGMNVGFEYILFSKIGASLNYTSYFSSGVSYGELNIDARYYFKTGDTQFYGLVGFSNLDVGGNIPFFGDVDEAENGYNIGVGVNLSAENRLSYNGQIKYSSPGTGQSFYQIGLVYRLTK